MQCVGDVDTYRGVAADWGLGPSVLGFPCSWSGGGQTASLEKPEPITFQLVVVS